MEKVCLLHDSYSTEKLKMKNLISAQDRILNIADYLHWWTYFDLNFYFTGDPEKRVWFVEHHVPRMYKAGLLKRATRRNDKRLYYSSWSQPMHLMHGLVCTRALLRFWAADKDCKLVSENEFRQQKFGVVPEWGILYPNNTMLLFEYCTADNVGRNGLVLRKLNLYAKYLSVVEGYFTSTAVVVFLLDTNQTLQYARRAQRTSFTYFVDLQTFFSVNNQLTAPIYLWNDGKEYSLT